MFFSVVRDDCRHLLDDIITVSQEIDTLRRLIRLKYPVNPNAQSIAGMIQGDLNGLRIFALNYNRFVHGAGDFTLPSDPNFWKLGLKSQKDLFLRARVTLLELIDAIDASTAENQLLSFINAINSNYSCLLLHIQAHIDHLNPK